MKKLEIVLVLTFSNEPESETVLRLGISRYTILIYIANTL